MTIKDEVLLGIVIGGPVLFLAVFLVVNHYSGLDTPSTSSTTPPVKKPLPKWAKALLWFLGAVLVLAPLRNWLFEKYHTDWLDVPWWVIPAIVGVVIALVCFFSSNKKGDKKKAGLVWWLLLAPVGLVLVLSVSQAISTLGVRERTVTSVEKVRTYYLPISNSCWTSFHLPGDGNPYHFGMDTLNNENYTLIVKFDNQEPKVWKNFRDEVYHVPSSWSDVKIKLGGTTGKKQEKKTLKITLEKK